MHLLWLHAVLHASETWPVKKENEMALHCTEMRMIYHMCDMKLKDELLCVELT